MSCWNEMASVYLKCSIRDFEEIEPHAKTDVIPGSISLSEDKEGIGPCFHFGSQGDILPYWMSE